MVETMENGRRQTWTAANVAALMFVLLSAANAAGAVILAQGSATAKNLVFCALLLPLAFGLWQRSKIAYLLGILMSSLYALLSPLVLLVIILPESGASATGHLPTDSRVISSLALLTGGCAMLIAFIALLSKSARREFGIGRFAALKKGM